MFQTFQKSILFTILFYLLSLFLINFQLLGINDNGWYINLMANFYKFQTFYTSVEGGYNYLGTHFSPFWVIFSPFITTFESPIDLLYFINYIGYLFWFLAILFVIEKKFQKVLLLKEQIYIFILFFSSITVLFNYFLNYNGIHEVLFAIPFLTISFYYLFIKEDYYKSILFYYPTLFIKEEFWLLIIFFYFAIFLRSFNYRYLILSFIHLVLFYFLYFKLMNYLYLLELSNAEVGIHSSFYSYLFEVNSISDLISSILNLSQFNKRIFLMFSFFIPFIFLVNWKRVNLKDIFTLTFLIAPTMGYCFLSQHFGQSNLLFDHYSLPIIGAIFIFFIKYLNLNKFSISFYLISNLFFTLFVLYNKQPWQYKYYQDEKELLSNIKPLLNLNDNEFIVTDDKTGLYFAYDNIDYINSFVYRHKDIPKYIVLNTKYLLLPYSANNYSNMATSSHKLISEIKYLNEYKYGIKYLNYPFIVYERDSKNNLFYTKEMLDNWDKETLEANRWF